MTPPKVDTNRVPSSVNSRSFACNVSMIANCSLSLLIVALDLRSCKSEGNELISCEPCETTGGTTTHAKKITNAITLTKIMVTAVTLDTPRERIASTAGFSPVAKKRAIRMRTNTWLTLPSALIKTIALSAPRVATKPK